MGDANKSRDRSHDDIRLLRALSLGTLAPSLLATIPWIMEGRISSEVDGVLYLFFFSILFSGAGVCIIGVLAHFILVSAKLTSYFFYAFAGTAAGIGLSVLAMAAVANPDSLNHALSNAAFMTMLCVVSAVAFRFGWGRDTTRT